MGELDTELIHELVKGDFVFFLAGLTGFSSIKFVFECLERLTEKDGGDKDGSAAASAFDSNGLSLHFIKVVTEVLAKFCCSGSCCYVLNVHYVQSEGFG